MIGIFRYLFEQSRGLLIFSFFAGIVSGAANSGLLALVHNVLSDQPYERRPLLMGFVGLCVLLPAMQIVSRIVLSILGHEVSLKLRMRLCRQVVAAPLRHLEKVGVSRVLTSLTGDVQTLTGAFLEIPMLGMQLTILLGCLLYLGWLSWEITLAVIAVMVAGMFSYKLVEDRARRHNLKAREHFDVLYNQMRGLIEGIKELKLHRERRRAFLRDDFRETAQDFHREAERSTLIYSVGGNWNFFVFFVFFAFLIFVLPATSDVSRDTLKGYAIILAFIMIPIAILTSTIATLGRARIALSKIREVGIDLDAETELDVVAPLESTAFSDRLELEGVTFSFAGKGGERSFTVGPVDLTVRSNEIVFLTGGNGSGKTTLAKILAGLYIPDAGEIRMDGRAITSENRVSYRQFFSAVFWDYYLFERLLGIAVPDLEARVSGYLQKLELDAKVRVEDGTLSTTELSAGQRKRLALLTAYLEDRPIYLFDEWAADQDPRFKDVFYRQLLPELKSRGKTVLVVSHDDRYYDVADHVVKLADGKISADGAQALTRGRDHDQKR